VEAEAVLAHVTGEQQHGRRGAIVAGTQSPPQRREAAAGQVIARWLEGATLAIVFGAGGQMQPDAADVPHGPDHGLRVERAAGIGRDDHDPTTFEAKVLGDGLGVCQGAAHHHRELASGWAQQLEGQPQVVASVTAHRDARQATARRVDPLAARAEQALERAAELHAIVERQLATPYHLREAQLELLSQGLVLERGWRLTTEEHPLGDDLHPDGGTGVVDVNVGVGAHEGTVELR
jgi:hypothetical protein